jgi:hypothetical protein
MSTVRPLLAILLAHALAPPLGPEVPVVPTAPVSAADDGNPIVVQIDLDVRMHEEARASGDRGSEWTVWSARFRHGGSWHLSRWDGPGGSRITMLPHDPGETSGHGVSVLAASGTRNCVDERGRTWRVDYGGAARASTRGPGVSAQGDEIRLWYDVPAILMEHSGLPDEAGECRPEDGGVANFRLDRSRLEAAGARVSRFGELEIGAVRWADLVEVAAGTRPPIRLDRRYEGTGFSLRLTGIIRGPPGP